MPTYRAIFHPDIPKYRGNLAATDFHAAVAEAKEIAKGWPGAAHATIVSEEGDERATFPVNVPMHDDR